MTEVIDCGKVEEDELEHDHVNIRAEAIMAVKMAIVRIFFIFISRFFNLTFAQSLPVESGWFVKKLR